MIGKFFKLVFGLLFLIAFAFVSGKLFFEEVTDNTLASILNYVNPEEIVVEKVPLKKLRIVYPVVIDDFEITQENPNVKEKLINVYEPLIRPNRDQKIEPGLALSWGLVDETTWEFILRPFVFFHDGSRFDTKDVLASLERARNYKDSELKALLSTIESVEEVSETRVRIKTKTPDPLLLQKLSAVLIFPSEYSEEEVLFPPIGTGSYYFSEQLENGRIILARNKEYWGPKSKFEEVEIISEPDKFKRIDLMLSEQADFLAFVPQDAVEPLVQGERFKINNIPSLEVQFLIYNFDSKVLDSPEKRAALSFAMNNEALVETLGFYVRPINQFVSNGVFGFSPNIKGEQYDDAIARDLIDEAELVNKTVILHLVKGLDALGEHVREQLGTFGVDVVVSYLELDQFEESIKDGDADIYFLGYRSTLGDSQGFFDSIVVSDGEFNAGNYYDEEIDKMIEQAGSELNAEVRLDLLQKAMEKIVDEDVFGIPLFEFETVYAYISRLDFEPRIDGLIYYDEIITE